jgi:aspartate aminotransferase-like enzyme
MVRVGSYEFKFAETAEELDQVHRLNFRTFVQEIPQHADHGGDGRLVDKFHHKNRYLICVKDGRVVGMLAAHHEPPFSVSERLPDPTVLTRKDVRPVEIRLLVIDPEERDSSLLIWLVLNLFHWARIWGATHFVISAVVEQRTMYEHLGFVPLGPPVGTGRATFQPMWASLGQVQDSMGRSMQLLEKKALRERYPDHSGDNVFTAALERPPVEPAPVCLLPGPVAIADAVHAAFREPLVYHRADEFVPLFERVRTRLSTLVGGKPAALFVGSGTLANDAVAATLAADPRKKDGLVLVNGEFGGRILKQARRWGLDPKVLTWDWGQPWDLAAVDATLANLPAGGWVWGVQHETSTGVLNDLPGLTKVAKKRGIRVCTDCVSSVGTVDVNLNDVYLASCASGKAIGSYAGIAVVFANPADLAHLDSDSIPSYLDVAATLATHGPRFTVPSPLVRALDAALDAMDTAEKRAAGLQRVADVGGYLRSRLAAAGLEPLAPAAVANPSIVTFAPPPGQTAADFVETCKTWGFQIAGQSGYLAERGLVQIAVMGAVTKAQIKPLLDKLAG